MSVPLRAGERLPAWRHCVTQDAATAWTRMLDDPNPIHHDAALVAQLGLGDRPINPGPANIAYFYNMLEACFPGAETRSLDTRLTGNVYVGDHVEVSGEIAAVDFVGAEARVHCRLELRGSVRAPVAAVANAEVRVPLRAENAR